jgi:hypothetical protein
LEHQVQQRNWKRFVLSNNVFYFTDDGQFGDASGLVFIEVNGWESSELEMIDDTPPWDRKAFAQDMAEFVRLGRPEDYWTNDYHVAPKYQLLTEDLL